MILLWLLSVSRRWGFWPLQSFSPQAHSKEFIIAGLHELWVAFMKQQRHCWHSWWLSAWGDGSTQKVGRVGMPLPLISSAVSAKAVVYGFNKQFSLENVYNIFDIMSHSSGSSVVLFAGICSFYYPNVTTLRSGLCCRNSVCRLSVTLVHPTQGVEAFGKISSPLCTLATLWSPCKILRRLSQGNPSVGGVKRKRGIKIQRF